MSMWDFTQVVSFKRCGNVIFAPEIQKMLSLARGYLEHFEKLVNEWEGTLIWNSKINE